jgi:glycosyltransferase involved in cell wall biosynthesis
MTTAEHVSGLKVALFTGDRWDHVCPIVRVSGPLKQAGMALLRGTESENDGIRCFPQQVAEADLVVVQRDFPRFRAEYEQILSLARAQGKAVIYELDDLLSELPPEHPQARRAEESRAAILEAVVAADGVTCSTPVLGEYLRCFNRNTWVLPNYLNDELWADGLNRLPPDADQHDADPVVIGYLSGPGHRPDLDTITPVLRQILREYPGRVSLRFWGIRPPDNLIDRSDVEWLEPGLVDYRQFAEYFGKQHCDIFIAPLAAGRFNGSKSSLKFLECSALGIPGIYSRSAPYDQVVEQGQNGLLAGTYDEWINGLRQLIEDRALRHEMGRRARQTVRDGWLLSQHAHEWAAVYAKIWQIPAKAQVPESTLQALRQMRRWHEDLEERRQVMEAAFRQTEQQNAAISARMVAHEQAVQAYDAVLRSPGWRLVEMMGAIRHKFAPTGSRRERALFLGMQSLVTIRQEGVRVGIARTAAQVLRPGRSQPPAPSSDRLLPSVGPSQACPAPAISIIIAHGIDLPAPDEQAVLNWVSTQTCQPVEVVVWDRGTGTARVAAGQAPAWPCPDITALRSGVHGRFVCMASSDLLGQPETYLDDNLVPLVSEALAFTINARGNGVEIKHWLAVGRMPGSLQIPLLAQIVRTECLGDDGSGGPGIDLSGWTGPREGDTVFAGKLIRHTTHYAKQPGTMPFGQHLPAGGLRLEGDYLVAPAHTPPPPGGSAARALYAVNTVMPKVSDGSAKPTIFVVMPFLAVGGAERVALDMMRYLQPDVRFVVLTNVPHDPALGTTADAFRQVTPYVYTAGDFLANPLNFTFYQYLIERFRPQTFYIANGESGIYDALGTLKEHYPELRIGNQVYDYRFGWINRYDTDLVRHVDAHIGANQKICDAYLQRGARPDQVFLIEHGVDTREFDPARYPRVDRSALRRRLQLPEDRKIVTFMARLHAQKRPMDFIELARHFAGDPAVTFLMVGNGLLEETISREIYRMGLKNVIRRPFYRPSRDIYAASDVFVLPSEYEGMPLVILEAQAMGVPVVVTDVGNTRDILAATQGGVLVAHAGDIGGLEQGVRRMLKAPPDPASVREAAVKRFGLEVIATQYRKALLGE